MNARFEIEQFRRLRFISAALMESNYKTKFSVLSDINDY